MTYVQCGCFSWFGTQGNRQCGQDTSAEQTCSRWRWWLQGSYSVWQWISVAQGWVSALLSGAWWALRRSCVTCAATESKLLHMFIPCMWVHCRCLQTHQKRVLDPHYRWLWATCGCWELNSGPLEEQSMLLTTEPSLQPQKVTMFKLVLLASFGRVSSSKFSGTLWVTATFLPRWKPHRHFWLRY